MLISEWFYLKIKVFINKASFIIFINESCFKAVIML